jgi:hypothetical protein
MTEKQIEKKVCDYAKSLGWLAFKFSSPSHRGVPDRIFLRDGRTVFIEFKKPNGRPSALQIITLEEIQRKGFDCYFCYSVEQGKEIFDALPI